MKKLILNLGDKRMLTKEQMKKISGGYYECVCQDENYYEEIGAPGECEAYETDCYDQCVVFCAEHGGV